MARIVYGTCDGTGAAINVCLGQVPQEVEVWNTEDAGNLLPRLVWHKGMAVITAMDEGVKYTGLSDTDFDRTIMAASGISAYNGGDVIQYDKTTSARWELTTGTAFPGGNSAEEVYVDGTYQRTAATDAAYKCIGDTLCPDKYHGCKVTTTAGFTIGADADINADGEQLMWKAVLY